MESIYEAGGHIHTALTLPDDRARGKSGRVYLDAFCASHGIPLFKVASINDAGAMAWLRAATLDWLFIVGWSQIAEPAVLDAPRYGVLGMHPTLLPEGRGRAAVPWAILKDLKQTGVTLFKLDGGVDTGQIAAQLAIPLAERETATRLYEKIEVAHRALLRDSWPDIAADTLQLRAQDDRCATVWPGRRPEDGIIERALSIDDADRLVRAVTRPYPGAFVKLPMGRLRIWSATPRHGRASDAVHRQADGRWVVPVRGGDLIGDEAEVESDT